MVKQHYSQFLKKSSKKLLKIDIAIIRAAGFYCSVWAQESKTFIINLHKID